MFARGVLSPDLFVHRGRRTWVQGICLALAILFSLSACTTNEPAAHVRLNTNLIPGQIIWPTPTETAPSFTFGFDRRLEPTEDVRIYGPLLAYLERTTGFRYTLHVTPIDGDIVTEIGQHQVDFAAVGILSYLQAHERYGARMLVRGVADTGKSVYRAAIVTRANGSIASVADLVGHSFAFGAATSTQGYLIPRLMMEEAGINLPQLRAYQFTGSHAETANAVISGRADAGGMQDTLAQAMAARGLLRIVAWSDYYPSSGIVAGTHMPSAVVDAVTKALLDFDPLGRDKAALYHWERTEMPRGFSPSSDEDYAELRGWAEKYGVLTP